MSEAEAGGHREAAAEAETRIRALEAEVSGLRTALLEQAAARDRLEQRLSRLRRVRARVRGVAQALEAAMAGRADDRALAERRELADARAEAVAARAALVDLRLGHWRAGNAASAERLALETAQAASADDLVERDRTHRQALDEAEHRLVRAREAALGAQREIERGFEALHALQPVDARLVACLAPSSWSRAAGLTALAQAGRLRDAGRPAEAAEQFAVACAAFPGRLDLRLQAAGMLQEAGAFVSAEQFCRQALLLAPERPDIFDRLGDLYAAWGRERAAELAYEQAHTLAARADARRDAGA